MKYITGISICLAAVVGTALAGCSDALLADEPEVVDGTDVKSVAFTATVATQGDVASRGASVAEEDLLEPLVLADDGDDSQYELFLHTYTRPMDYRPEQAEPESRGMQVNSEKDLADIHTSFDVRADREADGSSYFAMQNTRMSSTTSYRLWTTEQPQRWPGEERLTFNAVAPHNHLNKLSGAVFGKNSISFSYTALKGNGDNDAEAQTDLLMATATMKRTETAEFNYRVPLHFNHALSAIKFAVRDVLKGRVVKISIKGVAGTADCVYTADDRSENGNFAWTNHRDTKDYGQIFNHEINDGNFDPTDEDHDVVLTDKMPEKTFMLIPQVIPDDATIEVTVERDNVAEGLQRSITVSGKIRANNVTEWLPGHEYVYIISTSKDNWVYVFDAEGNAAEGTENIYVYNPSHDRFNGLGNNAYFNVVSYRYKANNPSYIEALPWTASHTGSLSYKVEGSNETAYPENNPDQKYVTSEEWIQDTFSTPLSGQGSSVKDQKERHNLVFLPHYISTDWRGDETMQGYEPYSGFSQEKPYDLSTFGGTRSRTTANCYVIDRGGWYMLPLVYGNAIKNGGTNSSAYTSASTLSGNNRILKNMVDYKDEVITQPYIKNVNNNCRGILVWQDAYNMISQVEVVRISGEYMLRFHVDSNNLQQGNAIVGLLDRENGDIMWSWHIWATEHWIDKTNRLPHVYNTNNASFTTFEANYKTGIRERGDVTVTHNQGNKGPFYMAPYNLGWCDPKKVLYLKRKSDMKFVQYMPDGTTLTGYTDQLPIIQQGEIIDYKYANNTYYQWGRKDPMRGYFNHESDMKAVFGTRPSAIADQGKITVGIGIRTPQIFYGNTGETNTAEEDWLMNDGYLNLWNNHSDISGAKSHGSGVVPTNSTYDNMWVHVKTVYDPCPVGYMVPNAGVLHFIHKNTENWYGGSYNLTTFKNKINGEYVDEYTYKIWGNGVANNNNAIFFSSTGNRWWTTDNNGPGGFNFNGTTSYAWSNRSIITDSQGKREAYGLALGLQGNGTYYIGGQFLGRRAMGRPVRAIREP